VLESLTLSQTASAGLAVIVLIGVITWVCSLMQRDVSLVDRVWSVCIAAAAIVYAALAVTVTQRAICMSVLVVVWALRLSIFITVRNWGHGEERRYKAIRDRNQPGFEFKSLYLVFGLQALLSWVVSAPFLVGVNGSEPLGWLDAAGMALAASGIVFEGIADMQMARFKSDKANEGQVMDHGLWRYSRHPNYFGEFCTWWGLWLVAMAGAGWSGWWTAVSPLLMTVLLLKVSGVTLQEKDIAERRPGYKEYIARTNVFVPGPPKSTSK
jgi:steroid 5-alpha reductase family enzyme